MGLSVRRAFRSVAAQLASPVGVGLYLAYAVLFVAFQASAYGLAGRLLGSRSGQLVLTPLLSPLQYPASVPGYLVALAATGLGLVYLTVLLTRAFARGCRRTLPRSVALRRAPWAVAHFAVGGLAVASVVAVGTLLLVVPGVVAYVGLLFTQFHIAVEDAPFPRAMRRSWDLTAGHRVPVGLLVVGMTALSVADAVATVRITRLLFGLVPVVALEALEVFSNTVVFVVGMAAMADAYRQLRAGERFED